MGACMSSAGGDPEQLRKSREIDAQNARDLEKDRTVIKMLILGAGESGKSTLIKQMITLYGAGFPEAERVKYVKDIHNNILEAMRTLVYNSENLEPKYNSRTGPAVDIAKKFFTKVKDDEVVVLNSQVADYIAALWADKGIRNAYANRSLFQLPDSANYYFDRIAEIGREHYLPTQDDVLRSRVRTTGAVQYDFNISGAMFHVFDVGGQKSERKKWINCFENVTAIVFVAAISEYDQLMYEDNVTNRLLESVQLFDSICNSQYFVHTSMILFLNKTDLFTEKVPKVPLTCCFEDYPQEYNGDVEYAREFVSRKFQSKNQTPDKKDVYVHFTTAVSIDNMKHVLGATQSIILKASLREGGIL